MPMGHFASPKQLGESAGELHLNPLAPLLLM